MASLCKTFTARVVTFLIAGSMLSGCYRYIPTQLEAVPQGGEVQLLVSRQGAQELAEVTDLVQGPAPAVRGAVAGVENGDLLLTVPVAMRQEGFHRNQMVQTVRVPTGEILSVGVRELDKVATGFSIGAAAAGAGLIAFAILEAFGSASNDGDGDTNEFTIFSLPLPIP